MKKVQQKELVYLMCKSTETTIKEVAEHLNLLPDSLTTTLKRNNLYFDQFRRIYKYIYKTEFKTKCEFINILYSVPSLTLKNVVEIMETNNTPIVVVLYKKTKIQLINPIK